MDQSQLGNEYKDGAEEEEQGEEEEREERLEQERCSKNWKEGAEKEEEEGRKVQHTSFFTTVVEIFERIFDIASKHKAEASGWR